MSNENKQHDERAAWKSVRVNAAEFDALMDALQRAEDKGYLPDAMQAEWTAFQFYDASRDASVSATKAATEDEPLAWRVEWVRGDHTWVRTYTNERDAVDDGQSFNGTVTPLFARATQQATTGDPCQACGIGVCSAHREQDHGTTKGDEREACKFAGAPKACYRVRCQLGNKCVDDDMSPLATTPSTVAGSAVQAPEGWKLVPVEPTPQMRKAAADAWLDCGSKMLLNKAAAAARAAISAAPSLE